MIQGIVKLEDFDEKTNNLLILDDLMNECKNSIEILDLFNVKSHHRNISVFLVTQNIFTKGKCTRDLNLNSSCMYLSPVFTELLIDFVHKLFCVYKVFSLLNIILVKC